jgi:lipocalin
MKTTIFAVALALVVAQSHANILRGIISKSESSCPKVSTQEGFNVTEYTRATWFFQKQQITGYQKLEDMFCVAATYALEGKKVPFFSGTVLSVYNYANEEKVNGKNENANGMILCARVPDNKTPSKLEVAPCFLPNFLSGDYWVVAAGPSADNYEWAIISGGQPDQKFDDGCTTKETGVNGSGFWFATRAQIASQETLDAMDKVAKEKGFTLSRLHKVEQASCKYQGAHIKK